MKVELFEVNYNDIFYKDPRGQEKYEKMLSVFEFPQVGLISHLLRQSR